MTVVQFRRPAQGPSAFSYLPNLAALRQSAERVSESLERPATRCAAREQWAGLVDSYLSLRAEVEQKNVDLAGSDATKAAYAGVVAALGSLTTKVTAAPPKTGNFATRGANVADPQTIELDFVKAEGNLWQAQEGIAKGAHPSTPRFLLANTANAIAHAMNLADVSNVALGAEAAASGSYVAKAYAKSAERLAAVSAALIG